jgi:hypothetical protein
VRGPTSKAHFRTIERDLGYEDSITSDYSESEIELATESSFTTDSECEDDLLVHAIILPNYKEEMETLRETLEVLASHQLARFSYEVSGRNPTKVSRKSFTEFQNSGLPGDGRWRSWSRCKSETSYQRLLEIIPSDRVYIASSRDRRGVTRQEQQFVLGSQIHKWEIH